MRILQSSWVFLLFLSPAKLKLNPWQLFQGSFLGSGRRKSQVAAPVFQNLHKGLHDWDLVEGLDLLCLFWKRAHIFIYIVVLHFLLLQLQEYLCYLQHALWNWWNASTFIIAGNADPEGQGFCQAGFSLDFYKVRFYFWSILPKRHCDISAGLKCCLSGHEFISMLLDMESLVKLSQVLSSFFQASNFLVSLIKRNTELSPVYLFAAFQSISVYLSR